MKYIFQILLVFIFSELNLGASLNITIISDTQYDDAQTNCTSEFFGTLIPFPILQINASFVLEALEVNETAWTGKEKFVVGCQNETGICKEIKHGRVPTSDKLNYTCVVNDTVVMNSSETKTYSDSQRDCQAIKSTVAKLDSQQPLYRLPTSIQVPERGEEWFEVVDTDYLKSSLIRRCQYVRKTDECSLRIEFGDCDYTRKGICYTDEDMSYQSSLTFVEFNGNDDITARDKVDFSEESFCYVSTATFIKETTENMPPSTQEHTTSTTRPKQFSDNPKDETSATGLNCVTEWTVSNETRGFDYFAIFCRLEKNAHQNADTTQLSTGGTSVGVYSKVPVVPAEPAEPRKPSSKESNNLWIIAVVIITLLVIMIIVLVMIWRHKRRQCGTRLEQDGEKRASTSDVSGPVTGSLRRYQATSSRPYGTDSGIEVLGRGMFSGLQSESIEITDLDEDIEETKLNDNGTLREVNVMSVNNENYNITTESKEDKTKEMESAKKSTSSNNDVVNESDDKTGLILDNGDLSELMIMIENNDNQKDQIKEVEAETKSTSSSNDAITADSSDDKTGLIIEDP